MNLAPKNSPAKRRRALQIGGVALAGVLAVGVVLTAERLARSVDALRSGAAALAALPDAPGIDAPCLAPAVVNDALQRSAALDDGLRIVWLPAALWADAPDQALVQRVADRVLAHTVLPALACKLNERVAQLSSAISQDSTTGYTATRDALLGHAGQVAALEAQLTDFALVTSAERDAVRKLDALSRLLSRQLALTVVPAQSSGVLGRALALSAYPAAAQRIRASRETLARRITEALAPLPGQLQRALLAEVNAGPTLRGALDKPRGSPNADIQAFVQWLGWVSTEWLPFDAARNPCAQLASELGTHFDALHLPVADQSRLTAELKLLSAADKCYQPAQGLLGKMQLAPQRPLIVGSGERAALNPAWIIELRGLHALATQGFMTADGAQVLGCVKGALGWQPAQISVALGYAREYQQFSAAQGLPALGAAADQPVLFDNVARAQLERAMNGAMLAAQMPAATPTSLAAVAVDQDMARASADFAQALKSLLPVQQLYGQLRLEASAEALTQCARGFAADALQRVKVLAAASKLYVPGPGRGGQLLNLGSTAVTRDYLARELARAAMLIAYAQPFLTLLGNSAAVDDGQPEADQIQSYWANTSRELQRYSEQKDASGQVGQIDTLLLKTFAELTAENCAARLAAYKGADDASDLFAERRHALITQVRMSCTTNAYTN